jgi:hypothetical protein
MARRDNIFHVLEDYSTDNLVGLVGNINAWDGSFEDDDWRELDIRELWEYCNSSYDFENFLCAAASGDFNPNDEYYRISCYGLESSDCPCFDLGEIADWIDDNFDDLRNTIGDYYAEDFDDCDEPEIDPETLEEYTTPDEDDLMSVEEIAATLTDWLADRVANNLPTRGLSTEQIKLVAKVFEETQTCLDPADVIKLAETDDERNNWHSFLTLATPA